jgi:hypothetical protein
VAADRGFLMTANNASRSRRFCSRSAANSCRSLLVSPSRCPASTSAWRTHCRTAVSVSSKSCATSRIDWSPRWHSSTIAAVNSGVNELRGRGFPMLSIMDILSETNP